MKKLLTCIVAIFMTLGLVKAQDAAVVGDSLKLDITNVLEVGKTYVLGGEAYAYHKVSFTAPADGFLTITASQKVGRTGLKINGTTSTFTNENGGFTKKGIAAGSEFTGTFYPTALPSADNTYALTVSFEEGVPYEPITLVENYPANGGEWSAAAYYWPNLTTSYQGQPYLKFSTPINNTTAVASVKIGEKVYSPLKIYVSSQNMTLQSLPDTLKAAIAEGLIKPGDSFEVTLTGVEDKEFAANKLADQTFTYTLASTACTGINPAASTSRTVLPETVVFSFDGDVKIDNAKFYFVDKNSGAKTELTGVAEGSSLTVTVSAIEGLLPKLYDIVAEGVTDANGKAITYGETVGQLTASYGTSNGYFKAVMEPANYDEVSALKTYTATLPGAVVYDASKAYDTEITFGKYNEDTYSFDSVEGITVSYEINENVITFTLSEEVTAPGEYRLSVPSKLFWSKDLYNAEDLSDKNCYYVTSQNITNTILAYGPTTVAPATGSTLNKIEKLVLSFDEPVDFADTAKVVVNMYQEIVNDWGWTDYAEVAIAEYGLEYDYENENNIIVNVGSIDSAGMYSIVIPEGSIWAVANKDKKIGEWKYEYTVDGSLDGYDVLVDSLAALVDKAIAWKAELNPNDEMHAQIIATLEQMIPVVQAVIENPESKESVEQMIADVQSALETYMPMIEQYDAKALAAVAVEAAQKLIATYLKYTDNAGLATAIAKVNEIISELGMWDTEYTIADLNAAVKALATAQEAFVAENAKSDMAVVKSWDFAAMADTMTVSDMYMTYSDETVKVGGTASNLGTGVWEGLAMQGANKFFIRTKTGGLYQGNGGGRKVGVLDLKKASVVTIVTDGECMSLADATVAEQTSMETVDGKTTYVYTMTADGTLALTMTRYFNIFLIEIAGRQANQEDESEKDDSIIVDMNKKVLLSANFDDGNIVFAGWGNNQTRDIVDGAFHVNNPSVVNSWESQIAYDFGEAFLPDAEYSITMRIRGSAPGQITFGLQNADDYYKSVGEFGTIDFDEDWKDVKVNCICNGEGGRRLIASIGQFEGDIYIDDFELAVYTESDEDETDANPDLRWVNVLTNSDLEGEDNKSFVVLNRGNISNAEITDGIGKDGSRGIKVTSFAGASNNWDAQFYIVLPEPLSEGTKYRVKYDARASVETTLETQAQATPGSYLHYNMIGTPTLTTDWQSFEATGTLDASQAGNGTFQSIAFNLAINKEEDVDFYFDNLTFEICGNMVSQDRISLQDVEFNTYDGWGLDAVKMEAIEPIWEIGIPSGCPYGDTNVNNGADLSAFSKMYITISPESAGMRVMLNRKVQEGNCADTEETSNLISIPSHAWCTQKYCTIEGNTYIIDLAKILKDQGFVRLHAIKGPSWSSQATILSVELERAAIVDKNGVSAGFNDDVIKLDFGFDTNLPDLVKAAGKPRLMYPNDCVNVKVNGDEVTVLSVEGFADGRFYVFLEEVLNGDDEVTMTFTNPADAAYHLVYNSSSEGEVKDFNGVAYHDSEVSSAEDVYSYIFVTPILIASEPETGSFNLPNNISEFKVTFDKNVDAEQLEAKLGNEILSIEPATGVAEKFILKRTSTDDLATGQYELNITNILPEIDIFGGRMAGDTTLILNVGKVNLDSSDTVRVILSDELFANAAANTIPMGYTVYFGTEVREGGSSQGSGSRMFDFAVGGDFTKGLYFREGHVEYGYLEGYELVFEAGKPYNIHFNTAMWKDNGAYMKFQIINELDEVVYEQLIKNNPNVNGSRDAVYNTTTVDVEFQAETTGYYFLKWWNSDANGNTGAVYCESLLANVSVKYVPNIVGVGETLKLLTALANAKSIRDGNADAKYEGAAFDALVAAITKYEAEYETYTAPSAYYNAAVALDAAAKAVNDHRALCDTYYALPTQAQDILDKNADKKFAKTELYAQLAEVTSKYVTKNVTTETNPETGEVTEVVTLDVKKIIDDAELQAAIDELQGLVNTTAGLFTEGASKVTTTGIAALVERFRLAADALVALGVPADDELVVAAQNALDDDDDLADKIKNRMKLEIFGQLKNADNKLFEAVLDTNIMDFVTPTYDLTVFVKNPNLYATGITYNAAGQLQSGWAVPGWSTPDTLTAPNLITGWGTATYEISDCMFQTWNAPYAVEQTIIDLPAGVYTIVGSFGERQDESSAEGSFFYVQTSDTPSGEYAATVDAPVIGQLFPVDNIHIENIVVTDGYLTIGAVGGHASHTFFNQVKVYLTGAIEGYDYRMAYYELVGDTPMVVTPGDANGDGEVTIVDVVAVVNRLLGSNVGDFIFEAADMNQDGQISIVDVVAVVNVLLGKNVQAYGARSILRSDIHVADAEVKSGETTTLYVELDNAQAYTALQMDVELPEGLNIEGVEMVGNSSHAVTCNEDGRIAAYSLNNSRFNGGKSLMGITVKADEGFAGTARVDFTNVRVVSMDVVETTLADAYSTVIGGATDIDDVLSDESVQVIYYTTDGIASDAPHKGLNIIKRIYGDGRVEVSKEMFE